MVGTRIANYLIQEKLGEGGMGVVYKGIDLNLDRPVAIKALTPELAQTPEAVERFRHEARALANLNHINIATLYSLQEVNGQYLMVMEYLEGDTFDRLICNRGRIPCAEATRWFKQALFGIGYAHAHGVIHRDIKPSNMMLTRSGIVKVMDFGIAKVLGRPRLTNTGSRLGTIAYMSPEQIRNEPIDPRSDIYSLSVTLFEMLTGRLPFSAASDFQLMSAHLTTVPPRLSSLCREISAPLEEAVLKGLAKQPAARFQTAEQFGAALDRIEVQALRAAPPPLREPVRPPPEPPTEPVLQARPAAQFMPRVSPPAPSLPPVSPARHVSPVSSLPGRAPLPSPPPRQSTTSARRARYRAYGFLSLLFGIAVLVAMAYAGLRYENIGILLGCAVLLYFFPILIAAMLLKRNGPAVVRLNALRGWTGIGWIEAMKQALADDE